MKCSQCGNDKLVKSFIPMEAWGDGSSEISKEYVDVYLCVKCGHYELFSMKKVYEYEKISSAIDELEKELPPLKQKLLEYRNDEKSINNKVSELEDALKSIDITIRQQQELKIELNAVKQKQKELPFAISRVNGEIQAINTKIWNLKQKLRSGNF